MKTSKVIHCYSSLGLILLVLISVATMTAQTWQPPIGIPAPEFGIVESYRIYDQVANRNPALTYVQNSEGGFYTHYVQYETGIDTNNPYGTEASPRRTVPATLSEGAVVELHGVYSDNSAGEFVVNSGGTAARPVFVRGFDQAQRPTLPFKMLPKGAYLIIENMLFTAGLDFGQAPDYMAVRHSEFIEMDRNAINSRGTSTDYASYIVIFHNEIHNGDGRWDQGTADIDKGGVHISRYSHHIWVLDNHIYYNTGGGVNIGGYNYPSAELYHIYVGRNHGHHNRQSSFACKRAEHLVFSQNHSHHNALSNQAGELGSGILAQYGPQHVWMLHNTIHDSACGIRIASYDTEGDQYVYAIGNLITDIDHPETSFASGVGIANRGAERMFCVNNTLSRVKEGIKKGGEIVNNVIAEVTTGKCVITESASDPFVLAHNLFFQPTGEVFIDYGNVSGNVAQMEAALPAQAYGNITTNPLFVDPESGNFTLLLTSPARDSGVVSDVYQTFQNLYGLDIRCDHAGIVRPQGAAWDIGAFEYLAGCPILLLTSPNGAETWRRGESRAITWNANGVSGDLVIELLQNGQLVGVITSSVAASAGTFSWTVGQLANGQFITGPNLKIRIHTASGLVLGEKKIQ